MARQRPRPPGTDPLDELLGFLFSRLVVVAAVLLTLWLFWHGRYVPGVMMSITLLYFLYLLWRPLDREEDDFPEKP